MFTVGQVGLEIPPDQKNVMQRGTCRSTCIQKIFTGPLRVTAALNHMHFLGKNQNVTLFRPNQPPVVITNDEHYSYKSPSMYSYDPPITIQPGDEIEVNCHYDSTSRDTITWFGETSYHEMCFIYMTYYSEENVNTKADAPWYKSCLQAKDEDLCWPAE